MTCQGCGGVVGRDCFNTIECIQIAQQKAAAMDSMPDFQGEITFLNDRIRFWAYCTWQGMMQECPERREELAGFFERQGISPYTQKEEE